LHKSTVVPHLAPEKTRLLCQREGAQQPPVAAIFRPPDDQSPPQKTCHRNAPHDAYTRSTVVSKSVANPWRDPKIAVLARQKAIKKWIRQLRGK
jgi:hypothetical protein